MTDGRSVHTDRNPGPVEFDPPLTDAESASYWAAITDDPEPTGSEPGNA